MQRRTLWKIEAGISGFAGVADAAWGAIQTNWVAHAIWFGAAIFCFCCFWSAMDKLVKK